MNDLERRTLLGAAGIGALAAFSKAGPLNPPAGSVAATGHTIDEVYNKIPAIGGADGRIPIAGGTTAVTLTQPGSYILTGPLTVAGTAIAINGSNITVDLNGHTVRNAATSGGTINVQGNTIVVRNGVISGAAAGLQSTASRLILEDLLISGPGNTGISCSLAVGVRIRRCIVIEAGTNRASGPNFGTGIILNTCSGSSVEDCHVAQMIIPPGSAASTTNGINVIGEGCIVVRNTVSNSTVASGQAFSFNGSGTYRENTAVNFTTPYSVAGAWTNGPGNA